MRKLPQTDTQQHAKARMSAPTLLLSTALALATLSWSSCCLADPNPMQKFVLGQRLVLKAGTQAQSADGQLHIGFDRVSADSRCPKGEQCIWAGEATAIFSLRQGLAAPQIVELKTTPGPQQSARVLGYQLRLLRLEPYPIAGKLVAPQDYSATLMLAAPTEADADAGLEAS